MVLNRLSLVVAALLAAATAAYASTTLNAPGTPCTDITGNNAPCDASTLPSGAVRAPDPTFNLGDPSVINLGIYVVPGDAVLFETATGSLGDQSTWSDVVHFENLSNVFGSTAIVYFDLDPGVVLPPNFVLSANAVGIPEDSVNPFTVYTAGSAVYNVFSDCSGAGCEIPEPREGVPEPATAGLLGSGLLGAFLLRRRLRA